MTATEEETTSVVTGTHVTDEVSKGNITKTYVDDKPSNRQKPDGANDSRSAR